MPDSLIERLRKWCRIQREIARMEHEFEGGPPPENSTRGTAADALLAAWEWIDSDAPIGDDQATWTFFCIECSEEGEVWEGIKHCDDCPYGQARQKLETLLGK